jgi:transposase
MGSEEEFAIRLTRQERLRLQALQKAEDEKPATRTRAMIVLLSDSGESGAAIAKVLGTTRRTVSATRTRWRRQSFNGLPDGEKPGRPAIADGEYMKRLLVVVRKDPREFGYAFSRWTTPRLVEHLFKETRVRITSVWLGELLRMHGFVWRKSKLTLRNLQDRKALEKSRRRLMRLKKGRLSEEQISSFGTATEFVSISCP